MHALLGLPVCRPLNDNLQPAVRAPSGCVAHGLLLLASSQVDLEQKKIIQLSHSLAMGWNKTRQMKHENI